MEWLEGEALGARIVRAPKRSRRAAASLPTSAGRCSRGSTRSISKKTGLDKLLDPMDAGSVRRPDLGALPGVPHAAADDRLRGALAARTPAEEAAHGTRAQRLPQRQLHGGRRAASLPCSTGRSRTSAIRCAISAGSAPIRGGSAAASCRSAASASTPICFAGYEEVSGHRGGSGAREVLGSVRLVLVGDRLSRDGRTLSHRPGPDRGAARHRPALVGMPGRLRRTCSSRGR